MTLLFVRHGIREATEFKLEDKLSIPGYIYSYQLGKFIRSRFGVPTLIAADAETERTIATGFAISEGCGQPNVKFIKDYFSNPYKDLNYSRKLLENVDGTWIDDDGKLQGRIENLNVMAQKAIFAKLSGDYIATNDEIENAYSLKQQILFSPRVIKKQGDKLFKKIDRLLRTEKLSVLVGHDESNISILAETLGYSFECPNYASNFIPPNSGFVFKLKKDQIEVSILYLGLNGEYNFKEYDRFSLVPTLQDQKVVH